MLVEYFVRRYAKRAGKNFRSIDKKTLSLLQNYDWPGNIRVCSRASHLFYPDDHGTACDEPRKVGAVYTLFSGFALRREHHV